MYDALCFQDSSSSLHKIRIQAKGWKRQFGPEDLVRDDHWTELALDQWHAWDAVVHNDGHSSTLRAEAHRLAACVAELRRTIIYLFFIYCIIIIIIYIIVNIII